MLMLLRHLLSVALLPFVVVVVVPWTLLRSSGTAQLDAQSGWHWLRVSAGAALLVGGFVLFAWCVGLFGRGTLAPWDPTRRLVAVDTYRHVRNPMISGVALMLLGEAALWGSGAVGLWAAGFLVINHLYFVLLEEPASSSGSARTTGSTRPSCPAGSRGCSHGPVASNRVRFVACAVARPRLGHAGAPPNNVTFARAHRLKSTVAGCAASAPVLELVRGD